MSAGARCPSWSSPVAIRVAISVTVRIIVLGCVVFGAMRVAQADYSAGYQAFGNNRFSEAFAAWNAAAQGGDAKAQLGLGILLETGRGVVQDAQRAAQFYQAASDAGVVTATYNLGRLYASGVGVVRDPAEARRLWTLAAQSGSTLAMHNLGAQSYNGDGVAQDFSVASDWFLRAASKGYAGSQFMLGEIYRRGQGVSVDTDAARRWYTLAARRGVQEATLALNEMGLKAGIPADSTPAGPLGNEQSRPTVAAPAVANGQAISPATAPTTPPEQHYIWIASFSTEERARAEWVQLRETQADLLADFQPVFQPFMRDGRRFVRLYGGAVPSQDAAVAVCEALKARGALRFCQPVTG